MNPEAPPLRILMVCMGNICRSPTAEGALRDRLQLAGLQDRVVVDSAGTHRYHVGKPPDARAIRHALAHGIDLRHLRARQVSEEDFHRFDLIYAMDDDNLAELKIIQPAGAVARVALLLSVLDDPLRRVVPDPYVGSAADFEQVLELTKAAAGAIVTRLQSRLAR